MDVSHSDAAGGFVRRRRPRFAVAALLVVATALAGAVSAPAAVAKMAITPPPARSVDIGIADQKPNMFGDARFVSLGIRYARLAVGWDVLTDARASEELAAWLRDAQATGVEPLISFMHSRGPNRRATPSPSRLRYEFRRLRALYPWVTTYATWNEANHCGEPLCHRPNTAAAYYRVLRRECPACTILAPEMLDMPGMARWVRQFVRHLGYTPRLWGLHNYVEANRFRMVRLRELVRVTRGAQIWLTEVGGLVRRNNGSPTPIPEGPSHAGHVTRYIFDEIVPRVSQIARVYIYHWNSSSSKDTWDSALITPGGRPRSALFVLSRVMRQGPGRLGSFRAPRAR